MTLFVNVYLAACPHFRYRSLGWNLLCILFKSLIVTLVYIWVVCWGLAEHSRARRALACVCPAFGGAGRRRRMVVVNISVRL